MRLKAGLRPRGRRQLRRAPRPGRAWASSGPAPSSPRGIGLPVDADGALAAFPSIVNIVLTHGRLGKRPALGDDQV